MGKKRLVVLDEEEKGKSKKEHKKSLKEEKGVRVPGLKGGERVVAVVAEAIPEETTVPLRPAIGEATEGRAETRKKVKPPRKRSKNYLAAKTKIDPTKSYSISQAIKLLKEISYLSFDGTVEVHLVTTKTGFKGDMALPYFAGKAKKVKICDQGTLKKIEAGKIDFDVLLSTPAMMPNLAKYAKILGPRGLMPNPKAGTIVDDPQKAIKKFQNTSISFKTEQNAPLIHSVFGKVSQPEKELEENLKALLTAIGPKNIKKAVIKSTMSPSIKLDLGKF